MHESLSAFLCQYSVGSGYLTSRLRLKRYSASESTGSSGCLVQMVCSPSARKITKLSCKYWRIACEFVSMISFWASISAFVCILSEWSFCFLRIFSRFSSLNKIYPRSGIDSGSNKSRCRGQNCLNLLFHFFFLSYYLLHLDNFVGIAAFDLRISIPRHKVEWLLILSHKEQRQDG